MKSTKDFRGKINDFGSDDLLKKAAKLEPIKKSGKEKRAIYSELDEVDDELLSLHKRDSILDYFDDSEEEDDPDEDTEDFDDEELEEEEEEDIAAYK